MGESNENSSNFTAPAPAPAPFLVKTYEMVDDTWTDSIVSWSLSGLSFIVWNPPEFARDLLPKYFKHNNFSSFIRQLNTYGFRKADPDQWEFANDEFIRGQMHLLNNIRRRKPIHSHSGQPPLTDSERDEYLKTIEHLKHETHSLQSELERHEHENREYENQLRSLGETLQNIDQRQKQLMITVSQLLQKPSTRPIIDPHHNKKRRLLASEHSRHEEDDLAGQSHSLINTELIEKLDSSLTFCDEFIDQILADHHHHHREDDCCTRDRLGAGAPDSPPISSICIDLEINDKLAGEIDVNVQTVDGRGPVSSEAGANDVFWQQFLTETPDSSMTQSDSRSDLDGDRKKGDGGVTNYGRNKPWWINVDHTLTI